VAEVLSSQSSSGFILLSTGVALHAVERRAAHTALWNRLLVSGFLHDDDNGPNYS